jgi:phosphoribosylformimino-5-aminoimidazole carboxamide ribotide isomerase
MIIIPAVDIRGGKAVRLVEGREDAETVFGDDPADWAKRWVREGAKYLHVVDLDGAFQGAPKNFGKVQEIVQSVGVPVEFGGGVRDTGIVEKLINARIDRVIIGSQVIDDFDWAAKTFKAYPGKIAVGIDAVRGCVAIHGWKKITDIDAFGLAHKCEKAGAAAVIYTDITRDGKMSGIDIEAMGVMVKFVTMPVIASGGVTTIEDVKSLAEAGCYGAIIGRSLYEGRIKLGDAIAATRGEAPRK